MLKNYIKTAWRNLLDNKFYSVINIVGLTVGLTVGVLILLWVQDELSFDRYNKNIDQLYKVNAELSTGNEKTIWDGVPGPIAAYALKEVPGVKNAARIIENNDYAAFAYHDKVFEMGPNGNFYVDPSLFNMLDFDWIKGDPNHPFTTDKTIIITQSTAQKFFGNDDPIGKTIKCNNTDSYVVGGLVKDAPGNSSFKYDMLFSIDIRKKQYSGKDYWKSMDSDWGNYYATTFLQLAPGSSAKAVGNQLTQIHIKNQKGRKLADGQYLLQPLASVHLYTADGKEAGAQTVRMFFIVSVLVLLIACINYVNLSTARAMLRSKEVSVRKIIGAAKAQLFTQFIVETSLFFFIALVLSFVLIVLLMPYYNDISGKDIHFNLLDGKIWQVISITILATLSASSIYPALLLSSFKPISALKGKLSLGIGNAAFRKGLVVCQFVFSVGLIIGTLVIKNQLRYIHERDLGYDKTHVFSFAMRDMQKNYSGLRAELLRSPDIQGIASGSATVVQIDNTTGDTQWDSKPANSQFLIHPARIDADYIPFFKLKMAAGSNFRGEAADSGHYILNETAVKAMGMKDPVGKMFALHGNKGIIIGVVKDFNYASLKQKIEPMIFSYHTNNWMMFVKTTGHGAHNAIDAIKQQWTKYNAGFPFQYSFMDELFDSMYKSEQRSGTLFSIFTTVAILISCLGLFGLATYTAQVKAKEIGIRKVLGASVTSITSMLSKDFLALVMIAILIATPITWYMMSKWLQDFVYKVELQWWMFALSGLGAVLIAFVTISTQAIKAAIANPVKSLRSE